MTKHKDKLSLDNNDVLLSWNKYLVGGIIRFVLFFLVWFNGTATLYRSYSADKAHAYTVNINQ